MATKKRKPGRPPAGEQGESVSAVKHTARISKAADRAFRDAAKRRGDDLGQAWREACDLYVWSAPKLLAVPDPDAGKVYVLKKGGKS